MVGRDSAVGIATVRGSNTGGGDIFRTRPDRPSGSPRLLYNGYWVSFPGVKKREGGVDQPTPRLVKVKKSHYRPSGLWGSGRLRLQNF